MIFLGGRGQAKTRMVRELVHLLDEWMPIVAGSEINDDPYAPASTPGRHLVADRGDDPPTERVPPERRYGVNPDAPDAAIGAHHAAGHRHHVARFQSNFGPQMFKSRKMKIDWPRPNSAPSRQRNLRFTESRQQWP